MAENPAASVPAASFDRDQATIRVCLAEVFDAMVQHTDFQHASLQLANAPGGTHVQPSVGTPGDSHLDTTTTHPLAACIPDDAMTGELCCLSHVKSDPWCHKLWHTVSTKPLHLLGADITTIGKHVTTFHYCLKHRTCVAHEQE